VRIRAVVSAHGVGHQRTRTMRHDRTLASAEWRRVCDVDDRHMRQLEVGPHGCVAGADIAIDGRSQLGVFSIEHPLIPPLWAWFLPGKWLPSAPVTCNSDFEAATPSGFRATL
jgi:hypothetical protein